ncbi:MULTISPECIES: GNAT family N-acetyltransferase [Gordonibacter]|uniref:GNAT family N-acetyltransferase n=1 Tax=Gordonibacter faecis TaxID=3047475 RepID=A0ABT7DRA1_9ACTN|nr:MULTISPECIES: GNAT family N-acetyltransferase [unclassified Gordonibacter]MDJ1651782.1 GNAT family N-acetyltransferase [Gordonibacter sp. KGMB12511]HIW75684.1 GNAT family N-acetyltransferase [Candidatus Gordonibacter avicola]
MSRTTPPLATCAAGVPQTCPARPILKTERLVLREMTQDDFPALCAMLQDPDVMYAYEGPFSDAEAQAWLDRQRARYRADGRGLWAVVLKETSAMIGQCGLTWQDCDGRQVLEVGYLFQRAFWHQGYATEAARACCDYAFDTLGACEVFSIIRDTNTASQNVARRNGMTPRLTFTKHYRGVAMPHIAFSLTREERDAHSAQ